MACGLNSIEKVPGKDIMMTGNPILLKVKGLRKELELSVNPIDIKIDLLKKTLETMVSPIKIQVEQLEKELEWLKLEDSIRVLNQKSSIDISFNINLLISAEDKYVELQLEQIKYENLMSDIIHKIHELSGSNAPVRFETNNMIPIDQIEVLLNDMSIVSENVYLRTRAYKRDLAGIKYELENDKNRDYLSYVQLSYDSEDKDEPEKAYSVEFGFNMPFIRSDRDSLKLKKIKYLQDKFKYEEEKRVFSEQALSESYLLKRLIRQK